MNNARNARRTRAGVVFAFLILRPAYGASLLHEGRQDAIEECSACHRVTEDQKPSSPILNPDEARRVQAPSFDVIAERYAGHADALARFIRAPLHPMREQQFLDRDLKAITRYISSLRKERW